MVTRPVRVPVAVGTKLTVMLHEVSMPKLLPQPVLIWKSPLTVTLLMVSGEPPYFDELLNNVAVCDTLLEPTVCPVKLSEVVDRETPDGTVELPLSAIECGLPAAESVMEIDPVSDPALCGAKATEKLQDAPAANDAPQVFVCWKSPVRATFVMVNDPVPVFDNVTV
jgi:hypothetical protein